MIYGVKSFLQIDENHPVNRLESNPVSILSAKYEREVSVEWFL